MALGLEVDRYRLAVILVPGDIDQGGEVLAVAVLDVVGVAGRLAARDSGGGLRRFGLDAGVAEPHFAVEMHDVVYHSLIPFSCCV